MCTKVKTEEEEEKVFDSSLEGRKEKKYTRKVLSFLAGRKGGERPLSAYYIVYLVTGKHYAVSNIMSFFHPP